MTSKARSTASGSSSSILEPASPTAALWTRTSNRHALQASREARDARIVRDVEFLDPSARRAELVRA
ncbi:MAG TPA: hypothetical protein VK392_11135, partial [Thermoanaerobaculia bacterium]|nr:hypothetical protein [Thermoanaerobaculia bacterium]